MNFEDYNDFLRDMRHLDAFEDFLRVNRMHPLQKQIRIKPPKRLRKRFNPLLVMSESLFRQKYHFTKDNMRRIIEIVRDDLEADYSSPERRPNQVPVDLQIMTAVRCWVLSEHPEATAATHGISCRTLQKICRRVASALSSKASRYIRMPATLAEKERVTSAFQTLAHMPQVIGALTHASVRLSSKNGVDSSEEHTHIQLVCDASLQIRDLDCRSREEAKDAPAMFLLSRIKERFEQNEFRGRVLIGGDGLPCTNYLFTPVQCPGEAAEQTFNQSLNATYAPAVKCLNLWGQRFGVLGSEISTTSITTARHTIVALALLHNMAIEWSDPSIGHKSIGSFNRNYSITGIPSCSATVPKNGDTLQRLDFIKNVYGSLEYTPNIN